MAITPMMDRYLNMKANYKDAILFYRLGDFYEMFFEDAELASRELGITLTGKDCGLKHRAPMCGVPFHAYESYAAKLVSKGYKVAICEQVSPVVKGSLVEREVVRIITPGTVIDPSMMEDRSNNYIMSIYKAGDTISFAYADISTGEFGVGKNSENALTYINDQIVCISPSEIICNAQMQESSHLLPIVMKGVAAKFNQYYEWAYDLEDARQKMLEHYKINNLAGYDFNDDSCIKAVGSLLTYLQDTQKRDLQHLSLPRVVQDEQYMYLDDNTRRNLELEQRMKDGNKQNTLLWVLDKTTTFAGARLLRNWINKPLQRVDEINTRISAVDCLVQNASVRVSILQELKGIKDIERYVARLAYGSITPKELLALADSIPPTINIKNILQGCSNVELHTLGDNIEDLTHIARAINEIIDPEPPVVLKEGGYIKRGFNAELDRLKEMKANNISDISAMEATEREKTGIKNLKIGHNRVFGYFIEINKQYANLVPPHYVRKQTISNNERYITEELKRYEDEVLNSTEQALMLEEQLYNEFKHKLLAYCSNLQILATIISKIDCYTSLSIVAVNNNYCKPEVSNSPEIIIKNGRHPVIEQLQKKNGFIENDTYLDNRDNRTMILTGPNMAGKSTFMRQVAIITLMAHIGSFVPASEAKIGVVDRIFTRIGASDDLAVGQSTFMVEMVEVSNILTFATNKSLIILDEVGRGTSTHDGMSIASAVIEYLSKNLNCKTLFATHYHELMHLEGELDGVKNYCISIREINGQLVFLRKIMRGSATRSYGIEVASLAGIPKVVVNRAKQILAELEQGTHNAPITNNDAIIDVLKGIDINAISPMLAFDTLAHLIDMVKE